MVPIGSRAEKTDCHDAQGMQQLECGLVLMGMGFPMLIDIFKGGAASQNEALRFRPPAIFSGGSCNSENVFLDVI